MLYILLLLLRPPSQLSNYLRLATLAEIKNVLIITLITLLIIMFGNVKNKKFFVIKYRLQILFFNTTNYS